MLSHVLAGGLDPPSVAAAVRTEGIAVILDQQGAESCQRAQRGPPVVREGVREGLQVLVGPPEIVACLPLLGDVADRGGYQEALVGVDGGQGDLGGEGGAVAAAAGQSPGPRPSAGLRVGRVPGAQARVPGLGRRRGPGSPPAARPVPRAGTRTAAPPAAFTSTIRPPGVHAYRRVRRRLRAARPEWGQRSCSQSSSLSALLLATQGHNLISGRCRAQPDNPHVVECRVIPV